MMQGTKQGLGLRLVRVGYEQALLHHNQDCSGRKHIPLRRYAKFDEIRIRRLLTRVRSIRGSGIEAQVENAKAGAGTCAACMAPGAA
jgi:hypothetical protein